MKKTKHFLAAFVAMVLALTTVLPVLAARIPDGYTASTDNTGSITLKLPEGSTANLSGMTVEAYRMFKQVDSVTSDAVALVPVNEFDAFFGGLNYEGVLDLDAETVYVTYDSTVEKNCLTITNDNNKAADPNYIPIIVDNLDEVFFEASLMEQMLGSAGVDPNYIAANAKQVAEWVRLYIVANTGAGKVFVDGGNFKTHSDYQKVTATAAATTDGIKLNKKSLGYWVLISSNAPAGVANVRTVMKLSGANKPGPTPDTDAGETPGPTSGGKDVVATLKLEEQDLNKKVKKSDAADTAYATEATANIGDTLDYKIEFDLQDLVDYKDDGTYTFKLEDTLLNQMIDEDSFEVTFEWTTAETVDDEPASIKHSVTYTNTEAAPNKLSTLLKSSDIITTPYDATNKKTVFTLDFSVVALKAIACATPTGDEHPHANGTTI